VFGNPVALTATVTNTGGGSTGAPTGSVTFYNGSTPLGSVSLSATGASTSTAVFSASALPATTFFPVGTLQASAVFTGSTDYGSSTSGTRAIQVDPASTSVSVSASTTTIGVPTNLTATVSVTSGAGTPSGSVFFESLDTNNVLHNLGTVTTSGGQAVLSGVVLTNGTVEVEATFTSSDVDFASAAPGILNLSLTRATPTLGAQLSPNTPMVYGTAYTLTGTLSVAGPAPTGTVTFTAVNGSASTTLGSASVSGTSPYTATLANGAPIPVGTQTITAAYGGDTDYIPVTFDVTPPAVSQAATTTSLVVGTTYIGRPLNISAHVANT